ncbi:MAG: DUF72 domain-containing protein [Candidatus Micrarchaeia archaeon]
MQFYIGTSGWMYDWNRENNFDWYYNNSGLNAVELNASFYRFPFPSQVKHWAKVGSGLAWAIKASRIVTHVHRLNENSYNAMNSFLSLFSALDKDIHYYLFQLPPSFKANAIAVVEEFSRAFKNNRKFVFEFRDVEFFKEEVYRSFRKLQITLASIDSPIGTYIVKTTSDIYLRMHGRKSWYSYNYSTKELEDIAESIVELEPRNAYVFFNNDHSMLGNARKMLEIMRKLA